LVPEEFDKVFRINVTANFRLLRSLDLLLRQSDAGRAVFITSGAARSARAYWGLYASSKAALEAMIKSYAGEMATTSVRANLFSPGVVRTGMRAKAMPGEDPETLLPPSAIAPRLVDMLSPEYGENGMMFEFATGETRKI
jgi:NAD(P)-dependent dehydrogenase (short-subunit alcohol dehydrogenase family)